jgi:hypothetical protein
VTVCPASKALTALLCAVIVHFRAAGGAPILANDKVKVGHPYSGTGISGHDMESQSICVSLPGSSQQQILQSGGVPQDAAADQHSGELGPNA